MFAPSPTHTPNQKQPGQSASRAFRVLGPENWRTLIRTGANMLIIGSRSALEAFLAAAASELAEPVRFVGPSEDVPVDCRGTLVLVDAAKLDERQQDRLLPWLDGADNGKPQVISLAEQHLWQPDGPPSVPLDLYYRLNTICLEIQD